MRERESEKEIKTERKKRGKKRGREREREGERRIKQERARSDLHVRDLLDSLIGPHTYPN